MTAQQCTAEDESAISEISIAADGRMYVFGASPQILEIMAILNERDAALRQRVEFLQTGNKFRE
jgi:hypothetical protein